MSYEESRQRVKRVHQALAQGEPISDAEVLAQLKNLYIMTNTLTAAELLMEILAPVCGYRPHLTEILLPRILTPLWMTAFETPHFMNWLKHHLQQPKPFQSLTSPGLEWAQGLLQQPELITHLFTRVEDQENHGMTIKEQQKLAPYSQIPLEQIKFRYYWHEKFLVNVSASIHFLYRSQESESPFKLLTSAIAQYTNQVQLFVLTEYSDLFGDYPEEAETWSQDDEDPIQVLWFAQKTPRYVCRVSEADVERYLRYTQAILAD